MGNNLKRTVYFVAFILLLFVPMEITFVFIHGSVDILLRDTLFVEGVLLLVLGAQAGEYIWSLLRNWERMRRERNHPTELMVGLLLLIVGAIYVLVALFLPKGTIT
jgi:hypothetical protein